MNRLIPSLQLLKSRTWSVLSAAKRQSEAVWNFGKTAIGTEGTASGHPRAVMKVAWTLGRAGRYRDALEKLLSVGPSYAPSSAYWEMAMDFACRSEAWPQLLILARSGLRRGASPQLMFANIALALRKMKRIGALDRLHSHLVWQHRRGNIDVGAYINIMRAVKWREPLDALKSKLGASQPGIQIDFINSLVEISKFDVALQCLREWSLDASALTEANQKALRYFETRQSELGVSTFDQLISRIIGRLDREWPLPSLPFAGSRPVRIFIFAASLGLGGSERPLAYLLDGLDARPDLYQVTLVVLFRTAKIVPFSRKNVQVKYRDEIIAEMQHAISNSDDQAIWEDIGFGFKRQGLVPIIQYARRFRPDVVYHTVGMPTDAILTGMLCGARSTIIRFGGLTLQNADDASDVQKFNRRIGELCLSTLNHRLTFVTNSNAARTALSRHLSIEPECFTVLDNGTEFRMLEGAEKRAQKKEQLFGTRDVTVIGYVGRFHEIKRPRLWASVALALAKEHPTVRFLLVGDGGLRSLVQGDLDRSPYRDRFLFMGQRSGDLHELYQAMDFLLHTSRTESLPNVIIEALGYGVYVVAGPVGDVPEILQAQGNGCIVADNDYAGFVAAMSHALSRQEEIGEMRFQRAQRMRARFKVERMCDLYSEMFENAAGKASGSREASLLAECSLTSSVDTSLDLPSANVSH
jgi:glycosyltransferase involved in cell wall biosynthesis